MISIIIPTLNEEEYLPLLLNSIKKQDIKDDYEIIVADAGSNDKTVEIAKNYGCRIVKGGLPACGRNQGAKAATGDLFLFLDADTFFTSSVFLRELLKEFEYRKLDTASFSFCPNGRIIDKIFYKLYNLWAWSFQRIIPHATNVILAKKEIHQSINGFDEEIRIAEDHDYVRRSAKIGKFGFVSSIPPVFVSSRRFDRDGRCATYSKYVLCGLYMLFFGPVKSDIFRYRFRLYPKKQKDKLK